MKEGRKKGRRETEGGSEGKKEGRKGQKRLDVSPDIFGSSNYTKVMTSYKVSDHPGNTG